MSDKRSITMTASKSVGAHGRRAGRTAALKLLGISTPRVQHALTVLGAKGVLGQGASKKVSARVDSGLLEAARAKMGVDNDTDLLTAALALAAGDDEFGAWLVTRGARLPADFELEF
jgi:hypothetical protein